MSMRWDSPSKKPKQQSATKKAGGGKSTARNLSANTAFKNPLNSDTEGGGNANSSSQDNDMKERAAQLRKMLKK